MKCRFLSNLGPLPYTEAASLSLAGHKKHDCPICSGDAQPEESE